MSWLRDALSNFVARKLSQDFGKVVRHETVTYGVVGRVDNRHFPAGQIAVKPVEKVVSCSSGGRTAKRCAYLPEGRFAFKSTSMFPPSTIEADVNLLAHAGKDACLHVVLERADACIGIVEPRFGYFIEINNVLDAHDAQTLRCPVVEERRGRSFAAADNKGSARCLPERIRLASLLRTKLNQIVVRLHEGHEWNTHQPLRPCVETLGVESYGLNQQVKPLIVRELGPLGEIIVEIKPRNLERREFANVEGVFAAPDLTCGVSTRSPLFPKPHLSEGFPRTVGELSD